MTVASDTRAVSHNSGVSFFAKGLSNRMTGFIVQNSRPVKT